MNSVKLIGNLSRDIELKGTKSAYCYLTVAVKNGNGATDFISVKVFGELATSCAAVLKKGDRVEVEARIQGERYDKELQKSYAQTIVAGSVTKLEKATADGNAKAVGVKTEATA